MRISSSVEYASRIMLTLAREHGRAPAPAERLAAADNVPADFVSQLLVKLRRAGLVDSHRGSAGGYSLSRPPAQISLGQIARAVEGDLFEEVCRRFEGGSKDCRHQGSCSLSPVWRRLGGLIEGYLDGVTLASLLSGEAAACSAEPAWLRLEAPR